MGDYTVNLKQFIVASDGITEDFNKCVWKVDIDHLPKLERVAHYAFEQLLKSIPKP